MKPIIINSSVGRTIFNLSIPDDTPTTIEITRAGEKDGYRVVYPALSVKGGRVEFAWDKALWNAKSGRYQGLIKAKDCTKCVAFHIGCPCTMGDVSEYLTREECKDCNE